MSIRKEVVGRYIEGFRRTDHDLFLSCLTEPPGHVSRLVELTFAERST